MSALFHDVGYLRQENATPGPSTARCSRACTCRAAATFSRSYLPRIGLEQFAPVVARIVHFTGYELNVEQIELEEPKDSVVGHLLGTADLVAQLADRCYLEKCRDRLYPEFVMGGVAIDERPQGKVLYHSAQDLLGKTLSFYQTSARLRLENNFNRVYRYFEAFFERGQSPYIRFIRKNLTFLNTVIQNGDWERLRRHPPCIMPDPQGEAHLIELALQRVRDWSATRPARPCRRSRPRAEARGAAPRASSVIEDDREPRDVERDFDREVGSVLRFLANFDVLAGVLVGHVLGPEHRIERIGDASRELVLVHAPLDAERRLARRAVLGDDSDAHEPVASRTLIDRDLGAVEIGALGLYRILRVARPRERSHASATARVLIVATTVGRKDGATVTGGAGLAAACFSLRQSVTRARKLAKLGPRGRNRGKRR